MKTSIFCLLLLLVCLVVGNKWRHVGNAQPAVHEVDLDYRSLRTGLSTDPQESCISAKEGKSGRKFPMVCFSTVKGEL